MNFKERYCNPSEKPLDVLVDGYSFTSIFRTIGFIGDSLSSGEFESVDENGKTHYHDLFEYSWGQYIARKNGLTAYNFSRGGMSAKEFIESFGRKMGFLGSNKICQAYVIALGVNDLYNQKIELGSISDIDPVDPRKNKPTFIGYYASVVSAYKEISPDAKFFFVTFPNTNNPSREEITQGMIKALYDLAAYFSNSYVIDLYKYGPVYDKEFQNRFYLHHHLNPAGYILTAQLVDSYIDYIVRHNPDDFRTAGFIGSGIFDH